MACCNTANDASPEGVTVITREGKEVSAMRDTMES